MPSTLLDDEHADLRVTLRVQRADMAMQLGELKEATDELLEVAEQAAELGRAEVEAEALLLLGDIDQRQGRPTDAHRRLLKAEELAGSTDDARLRTRVAFVMNTFVVDYLGESSTSRSRTSGPRSPPPRRSATTRSPPRATSASRRR